MRLSSLTLLSGAAFVALSLSSSSLAQSFRITDLGTLGGIYSSALDINNRGTVVGYEITADFSFRAYSYSDGVIRHLNQSSDDNFSQATAINDNGVIVGVASVQVSPNERNSHAVTFSNGTVTDLGALSNPFSNAFGINNSGTIVGSTSNFAGVSRAFSYKNGVMTDLGTFGGIQATGINDSGTIIGSYAPTSGAAVRAFSLKNGVVTDLGTLGGAFTFPKAINESGTVVGQASKPEADISHAFMNTNSAMIDLGTLGGTQSSANAINSFGTIVGDSTLADGTSRGFLYPGGIMTDLNTFLPANSGWNLTGAFGINDAGSIVGTGMFNNQSRSFLLTAVPEPSVLWMAGIAVSVFGLRLKRKRN